MGSDGGDEARYSGALERSKELVEPRRWVEIRGLLLERPADALGCEIENVEEGIDLTSRSRSA